MTTALIVLVAFAVTMTLLGYTVRQVFRDTPAPRSAPPRSHEPETFEPPWTLAA